MENTNPEVVSEVVGTPMPEAMEVTSTETVVEVATETVEEVA